VVRPLRSLEVTIERRAGFAFVRLAYPAARENVDLTYRPPVASRGTVRARVAGRTVRVPIERGAAAIEAPAGTPVTVPAGGARDRYGNTNARPAEGH
jgi:hypothetical protein